MPRGIVTRSERREPYTQATRRRSGSISFFARARAYVTDSLFRNSISQVLNLASTAGCGYGGLVLITHLYSVQAVGLSAAAVSSSTLVVQFTQFGTDFSLARYLPSSKNRQDLINTLHTVILLSTPMVAIIFLLLPTARQMYAFGGWLFAPTFIAVSTLQALITFLGLVFISDRESGKLAVMNTVPNAVKLVAPPALSVLGNMGAFLARTISNLFSFIVFAFMLARRGHRFRLTLRFGAVRELARFSLGMYVASTLGSFPSLMLPIIVLSRLGSKQTAYWSIAYTVAMLFYLLPSVITQALLPEISSRPAERKVLLRRTALLISSLVFPALAIAYAFAPIVLALFGHQYVSTALTAVRWLLLTGFMTAINYVPAAILFLAKKSTGIIFINVVNVVIVLGLATVWASDPGQVAMTWFIGEAGNTALFGFFAYLALREVGFRLQDLGADRDIQVSSVPVAASAAADGGALMPASLRQAFDVLAEIAERQRVARAASTTTGSLYRALDVLAAIAEQQRGLAIQDPSQYHRMTEPQGLFSVLMLQEAERARASENGGQDHPGGHRKRSGGHPPRHETRQRE
jgi:O-antigen/teichoic acid export membrane protein